MGAPPKKGRPPKRRPSLTPEERALGITEEEKEVLRELARRNAWDPFADLFDKQLAVVKDPAKRKSVLCSRRAGKTTLATRYLVKEALEHPHSVCLYIGLTRVAAKRNIWQEFLKIAEEHPNLGARCNHTELTVKFSNGSEIWISGATDMTDIEKLRGNKYRICIVDECASFPEVVLRALLGDIITPALMDYNAPLLLLGTPGVKYTDESNGEEKAGIFYRATTFDKKWSKHSWTFRDNPHLSKNGLDPVQWLNDEMATNGWTKTSPQYLREYCAQWVRSAEEQVYKYNAVRNNYRDGDMPDIDWTYILSLDTGTRDKTAFVLSCFSAKNPNWWVIEDWAKSGMSPDQTAAKIKEYMANYAIEKIVMDCGGQGLAIATHFRTAHGLTITKAEKTEKMAYINVFNGDLKRGRIKVKDGSQLVKEWEGLTYDKSGGEDKSAKNDLADAALYGYRYARSYLYVPPEEKKVTTADDQMSAFWAKQEKEVKAQVEEANRNIPYDYWSDQDGL